MFEEALIPKELEEMSLQNYLLLLSFLFFFVLITCQAQDDDEGNEFPVPPVVYLRIDGAVSMFVLLFL